MATNQINRTFVVPYPIERVKTAIEVTVAKSTGTYNIKNRNDMINSYFIVMTGTALTFARCNVQLKAMNDNETEFKLDTTDTTESAMTVSNATVDKFINKLTENIQSGEELTEELKKTGGNGCMIIIIFLVSSLFALLLSCGGISKLDKAKEYRDMVNKKYLPLKDSSDNWALNTMKLLDGTPEGNERANKAMKQYSVDSARWENSLRLYKFQLDSVEKVIEKLIK